MESTAAPEDLVSMLRNGSAPPEIRLFAARGLLPLDPDASLRALLAVVEDPDPETAETAHRTLRSSPPDRLARFLRSGEPLDREIDVLAHQSDDPFVLEEVVRSRTTADQTLLFLARTSTGRAQEALIANQARLLAQPSLVQALLENPDLTDEGRRLLSELTEEFFEKKARRLESDARRADAAAADAAAAAAEDDLESGADEDFDEEDDGEASEEPAEQRSEDASDENSVFIGAIYRRIGLMTISEKIALAYKGSKDERRVLIGDSNKLIGVAVLKSRSISINEVETFAGMRNLDEEVYRRIAASREWMRKPGVILALAKNPRVPLDVTLPLLKRLSTRDLRGVFRDRNLASALRSTARKLLVLRRR